MNELLIRNVNQDDWMPLAYLTNEEENLHRHLDWRTPQDWVGFSPFLILEDQKLIDQKTKQKKGIEHYCALLACPPDPANIAWVRLFAYAPEKIKHEKAWNLLWEEAQVLLREDKKIEKAAAVSMKTWFSYLLANSGFKHTHDVVNLIYHHNSKDLEIEKQDEIKIRPMLAKDLPAVAQLDKNSFVPLWHYSLDTLKLAFEHSAIATVWVEERRIVGYQISSVSHEGGHLSRLAVHPEMQGRQIGTKLVKDLILRFVKRGINIITVNTQHNNTASLAIYYRLGFEHTMENYPVYEFMLD